MANRPVAHKVRGGLYQVIHNDREYTLEEMHNGTRWVWRLCDAQSFHDPWIGDYATKREALGAFT